MASIATDPRGNRCIQFTAADRKRRSIRLGKVPAKAAAVIRGKVETLNAAAIMQQAPDDDTARWVAGLDNKLYDKLAAVGLVLLPSTHPSPVVFHYPRRA